MQNFKDPLTHRSQNFWILLNINVVNLYNSKSEYQQPQRSAGSSREASKFGFEAMELKIYFHWATFSNTVTRCPDMKPWNIVLWCCKSFNVLIYIFLIYNEWSHIITSLTIYWCILLRIIQSILKVPSGKSIFRADNRFYLT